MQDKNKISILEKRIINPVVIGTSLFFVAIKYALGGVVYATAAFFTKVFWEKWKSKRRN